MKNNSGYRGNPRGSFEKGRFQSRKSASRKSTKRTSSKRPSTKRKQGNRASAIRSKPKSGGATDNHIKSEETFNTKVPLEDSGNEENKEAFGNYDATISPTKTTRLRETQELAPSLQRVALDAGAVYPTPNSSKLGAGIKRKVLSESIKSIF